MERVCTVSLIDKKHANDSYVHIYENGKIWVKSRSVLLLINIDGLNTKMRRTHKFVDVSYIHSIFTAGKNIHAVK